MWLRQLFQARGHLAHGRVRPASPSAWKIEVHLILAAALFPSLLKLRLAELEVFDFRPKDRKELDVFERLVITDPFSAPGQPGKWASYPWNRVRQEHARESVNSEALRAFYGSMT